MISSGSVGRPGGFQSTGSKLAGIPGAFTTLAIVPPSAACRRVAERTPGRLNHDGSDRSTSDAYSSGFAGAVWKPAISVVNA